MDLSYQDLQYIRNALKLYIKNLEKYDVDDDSVSDDEFSEIQEDIMMVSDLLSEVIDEIDELKKATNRSPSTDKPNLHVVPDNDDLD